MQKRAGWLVVLFLGELLTASAMQFFEGELQKAIVLVQFIPLIISSGGNSGSQATSLIIRAMALGEFTLSEWWRVLRRELLGGLMLGLILGLVGFGRIAIWQSITPIYGPHWLLIATTVGVALVGIVLWGSIAGSMLPLILRQAGPGPGYLLGSLRGHARGRDGADYLLQRGAGDAARHALVAGRREQV
ncbi:MAG: magnesium transporter [Hymenobacter sp.]